MYGFNRFILISLYGIQDLDSIPEELATREGESLQEIDLTHNKISYPFNLNQFLNITWLMIYRNYNRKICIYYLHNLCIIYYRIFRFWVNFGRKLYQLNMHWYIFIFNNACLIYLFTNTLTSLQRLAIPIRLSSAYLPSARSQQHWIPCEDSSCSKSADFVGEPQQNKKSGYDELSIHIITLL